MPGSDLSSRPGVRQIVLLLLLLGGAAELAKAAVTVQLQSAGEQPLSVGDPSSWSRGRPAASLPLQPGKVERAGYRFLVPHIKIDSSDPFGETTLLAIRNESAVAVTPEVRVIDPLFTEEVFPPPTVRTLAPREVWPLNLATLTDGLPDDGGFFRGWLRIDVDLDQQISVDYFQIDTAQNFAAGSAPVDLGAGEFCALWRLRFLSGGGFSGGTEITFMQDRPLGPDASSHPASIVGDVFDEAGQLINGFSIWTDEYSFQRAAADLVLPGFTAGSIELRYQNVDQGDGGGFATAQLKANDRYSVSLKGVCLDPLDSL